MLKNTRIQKNGLSIAHWFGFLKTSRQSKLKWIIRTWINRFILRSLSSVAILAKAERQAKEMSKDWYAFNGLPKDKIERATKFKRRNRSKINVDNKDWEIIINKKDLSQGRDWNKFEDHGLWLFMSIQASEIFAIVFMSSEFHYSKDRLSSWIVQLWNIQFTWIPPTFLDLHRIKSLFVA